MMFLQIQHPKEHLGAHVKCENTGSPLWLTEILFPPSGKLIETLIPVVLDSTLLGYLTGNLWQEPLPPN